MLRSRGGQRDAEYLQRFDAVHATTGDFTGMLCLRIVLLVVSTVRFDATRIILNTAPAQEGTAAYKCSPNALLHHKRAQVEQSRIRKEPLSFQSCWENVMTISICRALGRPLGRRHTVAASRGLRRRGESAFTERWNGGLRGTHALVFLYVNVDTFYSAQVAFISEIYTLYVSAITDTVAFATFFPWVALRNLPSNRRLGPP